MTADIDLKKAAKYFANKFATGSSLSKNPQGDDEIFIQGDVADEVRRVSSENRVGVPANVKTAQVEDILLDTEDKKAAAIFGSGRIQGDQIEITEEKKKKPAA